MSVVLSEPNGRRASAPRIIFASGLGSCVCGFVIAIWPETPVLVRLLGVAVIAVSLVAIAASRRGRNTGSVATWSPGPTAGAKGLGVAGDANAQEIAPKVLAVAGTGTAQDLQTAMHLFGSTIVQQVDTSISKVLSENDQMREMAGEMATASSQAKDQFQNAMSRAVEAEAGIEQLNAFSTELNGSIQVIASEARQSIAIVQAATVQAATTRGCVDTMAVLSRSVSDVVKMIDTIARQTRLLALNATIEAARAGDSGKGFAVVASEVKQLARQTAEATQVIGRKIAEMVSTVTQSVEALQALVTTIATVDAASASIGRAVAEQESIGQRVSTSLLTMDGAVSTLSREIREAAQIAENSGMLSELVLETANSVDGLMSGLKGKLVAIGGGMESTAAGAKS